MHRVAVLFAEHGYSVTSAFPELGSISGVQTRKEGWKLRSLIINVAVSRDTAYVTAYYQWRDEAEATVIEASPADIAFLIKGLSAESPDKAR